MKNLRVMVSVLKDSKSPSEQISLGDFVVYKGLGLS